MPATRTRPESVVPAATESDQSAFDAEIPVIGDDLAAILAIPPARRGGEAKRLPELDDLIDSGERMVSKVFATPKETTEYRTKVTKSAKRLPVGWEVWVGRHMNTVWIFNPVTLTGDEIDAMKRDPRFTCYKGEVVGS